MAARTRSTVLATAVVALIGTAAGCQDPSTGNPPPRGAAGVPPFEIKGSVPTAAILSHSWRPGCPVGLANLRLLRLTYWGFDGKRKTGELVVNGTVVEDIKAAFKRFYDARYQFQSIRRVESYGGSDDRSMAANNTSAFNCRRVTGGTSWSEHAYGTAIDINPVQNPYVSGSTVLPPAGRSWLDRRNPANEVIKAHDGWVHTMQNNGGWKWGGYWTSKKDYQHFSKSGR